MASTGTLNIGSYKHGSTFEEMTFAVTIDDAPPASSISQVDIKLEFNSYTYKTFTSADSGGITIVNGATFKIDKHLIDYPAKEYSYDCKITFADGDVKYLFGGTWTIVETIS